MTLLPSIISSINPFSTPNCFCWAIKYLPDFAEIFFEVYTINKPHAIVKTANGTFKMNMEIVTEIIVIKDTIT